MSACLTGVQYAACLAMYLKCGNRVHLSLALVFKDLCATWFKGPGPGPGGGRGQGGGCAGRGAGHGPANNDP